MGLYGICAYCVRKKDAQTDPRPRTAFAPATAPHRDNTCAYVCIAAAEHIAPIAISGQTAFTTEPAESHGATLLAEQLSGYLVLGTPRLFPL
jgi:hypothetical protein